jgi:hypothetical protein
VRPRPRRLRGQRTVFATLAVFAAALAACARPPSPLPQSAAADTAQRLVTSKYEELLALPPEAPELRLGSGGSAATRAEPTERMLGNAPGFLAPSWVLRWTVEPWRDLKRVTVAVEEQPEGGRTLASLVFYVPRGAG